MRLLTVPLLLLLAADPQLAWRDPPFETPSPGPTIATPTPSPGPTANITYEYSFVPNAASSPSPADAVILRVQLNRVRFASHDELQLQVLTTTNAARVIEYEMGRGGRLTQISPGVFQGQGTVPGTTFFPSGSKLDLHFKAFTSDGKATAFTVPVTF